jgi:hypothetical protein
MAKDLYKELKKRLKEKENIDRTVNFEREPAGTVVDEVSKLSGKGEYKFFLQKVGLAPKKAKEMKSEYAYRWCYWTITGKGDRLAFGQFALFLSERDLQGMLGEARRRGWPI